MQGPEAEVSTKQSLYASSLVHLSTYYEYRAITTFGCEVPTHVVVGFSVGFNRG